MAVVGEGGRQRAFQIGVLSGDIGMGSQIVSKTQGADPYRVSTKHEVNVAHSLSMFSANNHDALRPQLAIVRIDRLVAVLDQR
jgi:hypothetical protein